MNTLSACAFAASAVSSIPSAAIFLFIVLSLRKNKKREPAAARPVNHMRSGIFWIKASDPETAGQSA
jgi:hypothetical protein